MSSLVRRGRPVGKLTLASVSRAEALGELLMLLEADDRVRRTALRCRSIRPARRRGNEATRVCRARSAGLRSARTRDVEGTRSGSEVCPVRRLFVVMVIVASRRVYAQKPAPTTVRMPTATVQPGAAPSPSAMA